MTSALLAGSPILQFGHLAFVVINLVFNVIPSPGHVPLVPLVRVDGDIEQKKLVETLKPGK